MSIQDVLAQAPSKAQGTTRVVVCQEVFDYKAGDTFVAVVHPNSRFSFMVEVPRGLKAVDSHVKHAAEIALKKAIWDKFKQLREAQKPDKKEELPIET